MLTPTKNLHEDKTIIKIGARLLSFLSTPKSINSLWEIYNSFQQTSPKTPNINFDLFLLAIDFLYIIGSIELKDDMIWRISDVKKNL